MSKEKKPGTKSTVCGGGDCCWKAGSVRGWEGSWYRGGAPEGLFDPTVPPCWHAGGASTGMEGLARLCPVAEPGKIRFSKSLGLVNASWFRSLKIILPPSPTRATRRSANMSRFTEVVTISVAQGTAWGTRVLTGIVNGKSCPQ